MSYSINRASRTMRSHRFQMLRKAANKRYKYQKLWKQTGINILVDKLRLPHMISLQDPDYFIQQQVQQIKAFKVKLNIILDEYCNQLLKKVEANARTLSGKSVIVKFQIQQVVGSINSVLQQLKEYQDSLGVFHLYKKKEKADKSNIQIEQENRGLENLRKVCQLDVKSLIDTLLVDIKKECKGTNLFLRLDILIVSFNDKSVASFEKSLAELIQTSSKATLEEQQVVVDQISRKYSPIKSIENKSQQNPNNSVDNLTSYFPQNISPVRQFSVNQQDVVEQPQLPQFKRQFLDSPRDDIQYIQTQKYPNLEMKIQNYFQSKTFRKLHHFFKIGDKVLYEIDLKQKHLQVKKQQLKIDFVLPQFFSSIITPQGDIYILGGSTGSPSRKLSDVFCYEHISRTLVRCGQLIHARSSFSCCVVFPFIYVFCGIGNNGATKTCERYSIVLNKSEQIADSTYAGLAPAITLFNKSIYKFGGFKEDTGEPLNYVEKYMIDQGRWVQINITYDISFRFYQFSSAAQINDKQLIVFGGYDQQNQGYDKTYLIQVNDDKNISLTETWPLPSAEGFWNQQSLCIENKLFALQNVEIEDSHDVDENQRSLLMLTQKGWMKLI